MSRPSKSALASKVPRLQACATTPGNTVFSVKQPAEEWSHMSAACQNRKQDLGPHKKRTLQQEIVTYAAVLTFSKSMESC